MGRCYYPDRLLKNKNYKINSKLTKACFLFKSAKLIMSDTKNNYIIYFMCENNYQVYKLNATERDMWEWVATHCGDLGSDNIREPNAHIDSSELDIIKQDPEKYFRENNGNLISNYEPVVIAIKKGDYINPEPNGDGDILYQCSNFDIADFYEEIITALRNREINLNDLREEHIDIIDECLHEDKKEDKKRSLYYYHGPLYRFGKVWRYDWEGETTAVSFAQAKNNLTGKAKKENNLAYGTNLEINQNLISKIRDIENKNKEPEEDVDRYCPRCGQNILSDAGFCPWCDDGDPEFDPKRQNEGLVKNMTGNTPYMLRKDGKLLTCGDIHPYIKMSNSYDLDKNVKELLKHKDFIPWFYENTEHEETQLLIDKFLNKAYNEGYEDALYYLDELSIVREDFKETLSELYDKLSEETNNEFCKVRTSNIRYKYGGDNGEIYFRISGSLNSWFDSIWTIAFRYSDYITNITVVKDSGSMSQPFNVEYCKLNGKELKKYPIDEFLTVGSNPTME